MGIFLMGNRLVTQKKFSYEFFFQINDSIITYMQKD